MFTSLQNLGNVDTILVKCLKNVSDGKMDVIFVFSDPENPTPLVLLWTLFWLFLGGLSERVLRISHTRIQKKSQRKIVRKCEQKSLLWVYEMTLLPSAHLHHSLIDMVCTFFGNGKQLGATLLRGVLQGASYPLPRKNFTPPLPIVKGGFGSGEIFSREVVRRPWRPPLKEWHPIVYHYPFLP